METQRTDPLNIIAPNQRIALQWAHNRGLGRADINYLSSIHAVNAMARGTKVHVVPAAQDRLIKERLDAAKAREHELVYGS